MDTATQRRFSPLELGLALLLFAWTLRPIWDIDIFMHIAIGRELMQHGIPTTDVLSAATPDAPWTPFQVGYELLVELLDRAFGLWGVNAAHSAVMAIALVLAARRFRQLSADRSAALLLTVLLLVTFEARVRPRPHVFNLLFEAWFLLPIAAGELRLGARSLVGDRRALLYSGALGVIWGSVHAMGALWLVAVLGAFVAASPSPEVRRWSALHAATAALGIVLVPGGAAGIVHVLTVQGQWREFVPELGPSWELLHLDAAAALSFVIACISATLVLVAWLSRPARERLPSLLCAAGLAFASIWLLRLVYYATFALLLVLPELRARRWPSPPIMARLAQGLSAALALALLVQVAAPFVRRGRLPWLDTLAPGAFPEQEFDALARAGIQGRAWNEAGWGGYALYMLYPAVTVASDGRITFGPEVAELLRRSRTGPRALVADVAHARFGMDLLFLRPGAMQPNGRWKLLISGPVAEIFSSTGPELKARRAALVRSNPGQVKQQ